MRRLKILTVSFEVLLDTLKRMDGIRTLKITGIPLDARVVNAAIDLEHNALALLLESREYALVREADLIPRCGPNEVVVHDLTAQAHWDEQKDAADKPFMAHE